MDENTPLVVPEVNEADLHEHNGIIANPNCSTIQMVAALEPIRKAYGLNKVIVSTYQAVSGAGNEAVKELYSQTQAILNKEEIEPEIMPVKGDKNTIKSPSTRFRKSINSKITAIRLRK